MPISNLQLREALTKFAGNYSLAADHLGCTRQNVQQRVDRSPELQAHIAQVENRLLDAAEAVVTNAVLKGDVKTALRVLQMKGKERGWTTRTELTGKDGEDLPAAGGTTVNVNITYRSPKK